MKILIPIVLGFLSFNFSGAADRPVRGQMKGMELYSWSERGKWLFVLLNGTNRLKSEEEVKKSPQRIDTVAGLQESFLALAEREHVVWNFHFVPGFSFPGPEIFAQVVTAAKSAQINLIPDKNGKR